MPRISFTENLRKHLSVPPVEAPGANVREALDAVFAGNEALRSYILDHQGRLRKHVVIFLNGGTVKDRDQLSDPVGATDEIFVFQALSGG